MNNLKLNETPVRTSRNFNINNINLEDISIPKEIGKFENLQILGMNVENASNDLKPLYGVGDVLTNIKSNQNLKLTIDTKQNKEIQLDFNFDKNNLNLIDNIQIESKENSKATVIIKYESSEDIMAFHNGIISVNANKDAQINIIIINLMNDISNNFLSLQNQGEENAKINYTIIDFGGKNSITNYFTNLSGNNSENNLSTIYLGKQNQLFDLNYIVHLNGKKTNVDIQVSGALKDNAKKHFKGTIDFKKGCKQAKGNEQEDCMLLSDTAKSIALPMLLCSEDEVEGNHATSIGKVGEKELFYIMSRGFEKKEAIKLLVRAKFNKVIEKIKNEEIKNEIIEEIEKRLD